MVVQVADEQQHRMPQRVRDTAVRICDFRQRLVDIKLNGLLRNLNKAVEISVVL